MIAFHWHSSLCDGINRFHLQSKFTWTTIEIQTWMSNHILQIYMDVITYPCRKLINDLVNPCHIVSERAPIPQRICELIINILYKSMLLLHENKWSDQIAVLYMPRQLSCHVILTRVTLYTARHLHTAVPHCSHSRAPIVHTAVPRENNEHSCVYLRCTAVCKLPGCEEGHPWLKKSWPDCDSKIQIWAK